jgi:hypothetical protein
MISLAQTSSVAWSAIRADEVAQPAKTDKFAAWTWEVQVKCHTGLDGVEGDEERWLSVYVPQTVDWESPKVHVFFGPGDAAEKGPGLDASAAGSNAVMVHGLRGSSSGSSWILIGVPGRSWSSPDGKQFGEKNGFNTIDDTGIAQCLATAGVLGAPGNYATRPVALRFSAHSRGYRGLRETIKGRRVTSAIPERVVVFDAAYTSLDDALRASGIPGPNQVAYRVTVFKDQRWDPTKTSAKGTKGDWADVDAKLTAAGAKNIDLDMSAMRAIGYSRLIQDAPLTTTVAPPFGGSVLPLVPRTTFTTRTPTPVGMTDLRQFARINSAAIKNIIQNADGPSGMKTFIDKNNLVRFGVGESQSPEIDAHHFFVAEVAHEVVD